MYLFKRLNYLRRNIQLIQNRLYTIEKKDRQENFLKNVVEKGIIYKPEEWESIRKNVFTLGNVINKINFDAVLVGFCFAHKRMDLAKSYFEYIKKSNQIPNNATIAKFLKLYYLCYNEKSLLEIPEEEIYELCGLFKTKFGLLDTLSSENAIFALSITNNWKECLKYLDNIRISSTPNAHAYSAIIAAAFRNNEQDYAWKILEEMTDDGRKPTFLVFKTFCQYYYRNYLNSEHFFEIFLNYLSRNEINLPKDVVKLFTQTGKEIGYEGKEAVIGKSGHCSVCKHLLSPLSLSVDEFQELQENFYSKVIVGKNVYTKTTPKELENFRSFLTNTGNADIVVDGLNVAYSAGVNQSSMLRSKLVARVVNFFVKQNKRVIVLGRAHMTKWNTSHMNYVLENASVFLTENLSQDDPFLLYAAMCSGSQTGFVSRDLMRSHIFKLGDAHLQSLFRRWQNSNQYQLLYLNDDGKIHIKAPSPYMPSAQRSSNYWHIPIDCDNVDPSTNANQKRWLCLKISQSNE